MMDRGFRVQYRPGHAKPWTARRCEKRLRAKTHGELFDLISARAQWPEEAREALEVVEAWMERNASASGCAPVGEGDCLVISLGEQGDVHRLVRRVLAKYPEAS